VNLFEVTPESIETDSERILDKREAEHVAGIGAAGSGISNDMRGLLREAYAGNERAALAELGTDAFCYRVRKHIGRDVSGSDGRRGSAHFHRRHWRERHADSCLHMRGTLPAISVLWWTVRRYRKEPADGPRHAALHIEYIPHK
jgi:hypothetical protein